MYKIDLVETNINHLFKKFKDLDYALFSECSLMVYDITPYTPAIDIAVSPKDYSKIIKSGVYHNLKTDYSNYFNYNSYMRIHFFKEYKAIKLRGNVLVKGYPVVNLGSQLKFKLLPEHLVDSVKGFING